MAEVAFLGTGIMGSRMAAHIAAAGHSVRAWNRTAEKARAIERGGLAAVPAPAEAAQGASFAVLMLSDGPACDSVLDGMGVYGALESGSTVVVMSSTDVASARRQAAACAERNLGFLDAPVSGGEKGAAEATLRIMAGGDEGCFEAARPLLECMGVPVLLGPAGCGQLGKLVNQNIVALTIMAVAESLVLAERGGLDLERLREALLGGFADSTVMRQHALRMIERNFRPGGPAKHQLKDLRGVMESAAELGVGMPMLELAEKAFAEFVDKGGADMDHSGIVELMRGNMK